MKTGFIVLSLLLSNFPAALTQAPRQEFTDPLALLQAVAKTYAAGADTFHMESIAESTENTELHREWRKVYHTAIKSPGNLYRIETRSPFGSFIQVSDGTDEWVYLVETKMFVKHPLPQDWPQFFRIPVLGSNEISQAWNMRTWLDADAGQFKHAIMLPPETITVEGHTYPCYVVHVTSDDSRRTNDKETHWDRTYWIDKAALVFRKAVEHRNGYIINSPTIHLPYHRDETTTYPVADFNPQTTPEMFRFTPPSDAKEVATFEPQIPGLQSFGHPKVSLVGQIAPNVTFTASDGKKIDLTSFRGKPLLLDFWATWRGPCLLSMPALDRIYRDVKDKGIAVVTVDQETDPEDAAAYLLRHRYNWVNYSDADKNIGKAFNGGGIPLTVLIDSQGEVVYEDFGGDEPAVRRAIAALGPEFASIAASEKSPAPTPVNAPH